MKLDQLVDHKMRYIFLEKSHAKFGIEASPIPFSEDLKLSISLEQ